MDGAETVGVLNPSSGAEPCLFYLNSHLAYDPDESEVTVVSEIGT